MINFKTFFEQFANAETIALLPGGFKPPTKGHFLALETLLQNCTSGIVYIGKSPRDGIDQEMSYQIWTIYKPYLSKPVEIVKAPITPVKSVYDYAESNKTVNIIVGAGAKDEDVSRYNHFLKNPQQYPNVYVQKIAIQGEGISGTKTREAIMAKDPEVVDYFAPEQLKPTDKDRIKSILGIA